MTCDTAQKRPLSMTSEATAISLDRLQALLSQEKAYSVPQTYIPDEFSDDVVESYAKWRFTMIEWFQDLIETFQWESETLEVAVSILDRYVAAKPDKLMKKSREYKMAALTCLYIAVKMHEPDCMTPDHAYDLSFEIHMAEMTIEEEEIDIMNTLGWRANPPTPSAFARELFSLILSDFSVPEDEVMGMVRTQLDQMLSEEIFVTERPSMLVVAALYNAITSYLHTDEMPRFIESRLFKVLGLYSDVMQAIEEIDRLRRTISTIETLRTNENYDDHYESEEEPHEEEEDDVSKVVPPTPSKEEDPVENSSPRSTATKTLSC